MSIRIMSQVWDITLPDSQKIVLLALADSANDEGHCWPSMASLSRKCSKGERTIQGVIKDLVAAGHLTRKEVPGKGCHYYVHPIAKAEAQPPQPVRGAAAAGRRDCGAQGLRDTPAAAADKPSRTITKDRKGAGECVIPDDWEPRPFGLQSKSQKIVDGWPPGEVETQVEHFTAHHRKKGSRFVDWQAAWSTWVLNGRTFGSQHDGSNDHQREPARHRRWDRRTGFERAADEHGGLRGN